MQQDSSPQSWDPSPSLGMCFKQQEVSARAAAGSSVQLMMLPCMEAQAQAGQANNEAAGFRVQALGSSLALVGLPAWRNSWLSQTPASL